MGIRGKIKKDFNSTSLLFLLILLLVLKQPTKAQDPSSYYWYNDGEKVELRMHPNYIVEFDGADSNENVSRSYKPLQEKKLTGGGKLVKLSISEFNEVLKKNMNSKQNNTHLSPLFKDAKGSVKAFAGGVLVTFKPGTTEGSIQSIVDQYGLKLKKKFAVQGQNPIWLLEAVAGVESLFLANTLFESHSDLIESSRPNFWRPINTRELKGIDFPRRNKRKNKKY